MTTLTTWQKFKLPISILLAFLAMAAWVTFGRIVFGVFGWMVFVMILTLAPLTVVYGSVLAIIVAVRQRTYRYRRRGPFVVWTAGTLVALFIAGAFVPDAGDSKDSGSSLVSVLAMDRSNGELIAVSGAITGWAIFAALVASVMAFIFAFAERPKRQIQPDLKQAD